MPTAVRLAGIVKRYPGGVVANDGAELTVAPGSVHALLGENGAGKSTLMKILYGMIRPDAGDIFIADQPRRFSDPGDAIAAGVGMVHQHFMLVPTLTVAENVVLGREQRATGIAGVFGAWDRARARTDVAALSTEHGLAADPDAKVESLSVGQQQRVEILKALYHGARILILDEPTAVLTAPETDQLFTTLRRLRDSGVVIIFISHKLKEVMALCDTATVMRQGKTVGTRAIRDTNAEELSRLMLGQRIIAERHPAARAYDGKMETILSLQNVSVLGARGEMALKDLSLEVHAGEILGVAGVEGNGQRELAEAASGLRAIVSGQRYLRGKAGFVPEDRRRDGLLLKARAWENALLGRQREQKFGAPWKLDREAARAAAATLIVDYDVRPPQTERPADGFSGGNQQKLVVGREIAKAPQLLVVSQPTRGVDPGASRLIHEKLLEAKARGTAVLLISSDLDEILSLSDRVAVLCAGRVVGQCARGEATSERLGLWMAGVAQ